MKEKSFKNLCENAKRHDKIANAKALTEALPDLIAVMDAVKNMSALVETGKKIIKALSASCSDYALKHPGCFDSGLMPKEKGVNHGDITIDDVKYHFVNGIDGYKRANGVNLSQEFLASLPSNWVRSKLEIDVTGIDRGGISDDELLEKGLVQKEKNTWSVA